MRVLMLGGTVFLGRAIVEGMLERGWEVTLFHRGERGAALFPGLARVLGDRARDLDRIAGDFDAVVDTCGYVPAPVRYAAQTFAARAKRYLFVSTISVYDLQTLPLDETSSLKALPAGESDETLRAEYYGELKVRCERAASDGFGASRTIVVRPGLIVGPHDPTDRYSYWPARVARGGRVLAPGSPRDAVQYVDVRDLARFCVVLLERDEAGIFNATSPAGARTMGSMIEACVRAAQTETTVLWVEHDDLLAQNVAPWSDLPLWLPPGEDRKTYEVEVSRAVAAGLAFRSEEQTARDTLAWLQTLPRDRAPKAGIGAEREAELLRTLG